MDQSRPERERVRRGARRARAFALVAAALTLALGVGCAGPAPTAVPDDDLPSEKEHLARRGFYDRRASATGWFLARPDPLLEQSRALSSVLRAAPGIRVIGREGGASAVSGRQPGRCPLAVFVDGSYTTIINVDELTLEDIEALEVYRGPAEIPAGFHPPPYDVTCGALLVWSRIDHGDE